MVSVDTNLILSSVTFCEKASNEVRSLQIDILKSARLNHHDILKGHYLELREVLAGHLIKQGLILGADNQSIERDVKEIATLMNSKEISKSRFHGLLQEVGVI